MSTQFLGSRLDGSWNWTPVGPGWRVSVPDNATHSLALVGWTDEGEPITCQRGRLVVWEGPFVVFYLT